MRHLTLTAGLAVALILLPAESRACSIVPPDPSLPPPTAAERDTQIRQSYAAWGSVLEVVATRGSTLRSPGSVRILRVYKGYFRPGMTLSLRAMSSSMCGAGDFQRGARGIIVLAPRPPYFFNGFLQPDTLASFRRLGLMPQD